MNELQPDRTQALMILAGLPGVGPVLINRLLAAFEGDPLAVLAAGVERLRAVRGVPPKLVPVVGDWRKHFDLRRELARMAACGADFLVKESLAYPALLREVPDPPAGLYRIGGYNMADPCVAIVGSRRTSPYGVGLARDFAAGLVGAGFCVVSGLARGIDSAAHTAALEAGGRTIGVLGTGIDLVYPAENARLFERIAESGAILSEFPCTRQADKQSFAMRNRLVSGMVRALVVIESDLDGGSMITAKFAADQGRIVCAVPGRVDHPGSRGCHRLIREGATLVTSVDEVLEELQYLKGLSVGVLQRPTPERPGLSSEEQAVFNCFQGGEAHSVESLLAALGGDPGSHSSTLLLLELKGLIERRLDGTYESVRL